MKRKASALALLAALSGCAGVDRTGPAQITSARPIAGMQGPYGEPVQPVAARPAGSGVVQASAMAPASQADPNVVQARFGVKNGAVGMPSPLPGGVAAVGALPGIPMAPGMMQRGARTSVRFTSPAGMQIAWFAPSPDGRSGFTPTQVEVPGRYNFPQGGVYRLRLSNIPSRPDLELYPTLEVMPANCRTATFLAHSTVPVSFTEEDFEQVHAGNLVVKVIYLPDPQFQDLAVAGPDEVVSTRLEPGVDPIQEAMRRGTVLAVVRMGNIDLEDRNTPAMTTPPSGGPFQGMPLMPAPGSLPPGALPLPQTGAPMQMPGRATIGAPPTIKMPDAGAMAPTQGGATVSADGMMGRMK
jgi:hypothetical protein